MSWDIDLYGEIDGIKVHLGDWNYTSNAWSFLDPVIKNVGIPNFTIAELDGKASKDCIDDIRAILIEIVTNKVEYEKHNPENGWGSVETFIPFWQDFYDTCYKFPSAIIYTDV